MSKTFALTRLSHEINVKCINYRIAPELVTVENDRNATYWNIEDGYTPNVNESLIYPYRVFGSGLRDSLITMLGIYLDETHEECSLLAQGFRLSLHAPDELPRLPDDFVHIPYEQDIYISVKPNMITTSNGLRKYSPATRSCFFKTERKLRFFNFYSQQNCEFECLGNYTRDICGCTKFSMPSELAITHRP